MTVRPVPRCRCRARLAVNGDSAQTAPVRLHAWLEIAVFAVLCLALRAPGAALVPGDGDRLLQQPPPPGPSMPVTTPRPGQRAPVPARSGSVA
jgi:hypothetical protein